jgi:hypothetical protein
LMYITLTVSCFLKLFNQKLLAGVKFNFRPNHRKDKESQIIELI